jgi:catechol-2,3-dioxygenase
LNRIELYTDRPDSELPRNPGVASGAVLALWWSPDGSLAMYTRPLHVRKLLAEAHENHLARGQRPDDV